MSEIDKTALSYWFPKLEAAGLPVPRTKILAMPVEAQEDIWLAFDGQEGPGAIKPFAAQIAEAAAEFGYPFFLRTDYTSAKHNWKDACFVPSADVIINHLMSIVEYSECADIMGMPWSNWVVREMLPTTPLGICPAFSNMPVCREFRFFVEDERIICRHPYWPAESLEQGGADPSLDFEALCRVDDDGHLNALAAAAGAAVGGAWSVDILETKRGWMVTDMAEAHKSFHWEGCEKAA